MLHIRVNATTANLCIGFDTLGMALDLANEFYFEVSDTFSFIGFAEKYCNDDNLVKLSYEYVFNKLGKKVIPVQIKIIERVPISRGMGSSSTLIVAGVFAANYYLGSSLSEEECFKLCTELEGHPDNVAPAIFGGFVACYDNGKYIKYPVSDDLKFVVISPKKELSTKMARGVLPKNLEYSKIISNLSRIIHLPIAMKDGNLELLLDLFKDELHEPYRMPLIEHSYEYKEMANADGNPFCISGSGTSMLIICKDTSNVDKYKIYNDEVRVLNIGRKVEVIYE